jgi:hypothetical protein
MRLRRPLHAEPPVAPEWVPSNSRLPSQLNAAGLDSIFFVSPDPIWSGIRYIESCPIKSGFPLRHWPLMSAYGSWPLCEGHRLASLGAHGISGLFQLQISPAIANDE